MRCPACDHTNRPERRFCTACGTRLVRARAACGTLADAGEKFCGHYGTALTAAVFASPPLPQPARRLAERIRQSK